MTSNKLLIDYCIRLADDRSILGHRLGELCGHGPILEEDIASTNFALDLIGQANSLYEYAAELTGNDCTADKLAYFRTDMEYRNILMVEQNNDDFAHVQFRQFLFDSFSLFFFQALAESKDERLAAIAKKSLKEVRYHFRHSSQWILRLGDGTEESHERLQTAMEFYWMYTVELFEKDDLVNQLIAEGIAPDTDLFKEKWLETVNSVLEEATMKTQSMNTFMQTGGRRGVHTEALGHLLACMQVLPRMMPECEW